MSDVSGVDEPGVIECLQSFLEEKYGPVESCVIDAGQNRGKRARTLQSSSVQVRFLYKADAEKIFHGKELIGLTARVLIPCYLSIMQNDCTAICARPANRYAGMLESLTEDYIVEFTATGFALGYWVPPDQDMYSDFLLDTSQSVEEIAVWLEELDTQITPTVQINLKNRLITLSIIVYQDQEQVQRQVLSFKFKTLMGTIEFCESSLLMADQLLWEANRNKFIKAMVSKLAAHTLHNHWTVVPADTKPPNHCPTSMVWSMKCKRNPAGNVIKHKA